MTLKQLHYVLEIANCGSITEAAKRLFISQPSLSAAVQSLEQELNIVIFNRSAKGIFLSSEGAEFLSYARQVTEQTALLEQRYLHRKPQKQLCAISTQHYTFSVSAFVSLISSMDAEEYECTLRETRTHEIIEDVRTMRSEVGVLYLNPFNEKVIGKLLRESGLRFHSLTIAKPHVLLREGHPLSALPKITLADLERYPFLAFEQGEFNSFYFSEELHSTIPRAKTIRVSDRATLFNLLVGVDGYTISSGILNPKDRILAVPLESDDYMRIGWIENTRLRLSPLALRYIAELESILGLSKQTGIYSLYPSF